MITIQKELSASDHFPYLSLATLPKNFVIFDIETTGLKKETSMLYLIGCIYYEKNRWLLVQWFNDDGTSESEIIDAFFSILTPGKSHLITYNGARFDIPYVNYKANLPNRLMHSNATSNFLFTFHHSDLYREFSKLKNLLLLDKRRQKDLEAYFGIGREDVMDGGQLIPVYFSYLKTKKESLRALLLLHNSDDIIGLFSLLGCFLSYDALSQNDISLKQPKKEKDNMLYLPFTLPYKLPREIKRKENGIFFHVEKERGMLTVPIQTRELKFFYSDYKNYYYLPAEDCAIHKSIAQFVDKGHKKKATARTCYQKKKSNFILLPDAFPDDELHSFELFQEEYKQKQHYIAYRDDFPLSFWEQYIHFHYQSLL